jgi:hypothetical protein
MTSPMTLTPRRRHRRRGASGGCCECSGPARRSSGGEYAMVTQTLGEAAGWLTFSLAGVSGCDIPGRSAFRHC